MIYWIAPERPSCRTEQGLEMTSDAKKNQILGALYSAASDPSLYEEFIASIENELEQPEPEEMGSWLEPHLQSAISIYEKLNYAGMLNHSNSEIVLRFNDPAAIVTSLGEVVSSNTSWDEQVGVEHLKTISPSENDRSVIEDAMRSLHAILEDRSKIVLLQSQEAAQRIFTFRRLPVTEGGKVNGGSILVRTLGFSWIPILERFVKEQFGLTDVEFQTLRLIIDGQTLTEVGETLNRGRETIKSHAKSIYAKLDVTGREGATKIIMQLHSLLAPNAQKQVSRDTTDRSGTVMMKTGRTLYWEEKGAINGRRILFLHGLSLGHHFSIPFEAQLAKAGLTLVCVERPGYGRSDPPKDWRRGLEEWIDVFPELNASLGLGRSPIVTQTGGILPATAVAAFNPNLVSGICAFAPGVPITDRTKLSRYPVQVRLISRAARISASFLRFLVTNGTHYFRSAQGRESVIDRTYASSPVDKATLVDPHTRDQIRASIEMIADGGFDGFISDNLHIFGDWSRYPKLAKCEIAYLSGTEDPICPLDWSLEFAEIVDNVTVSVAKGAGNLMIHSHPERCVEHIQECLARFDQI